ncbi:Hypothetical_protein [Hexamita inflata]|uniref:Hypothetical_protein n=1 Tax=Hexamita inflata TaxID=28002 RepID=A0AA86NMU8_9EUKA|nr:Hypothetical protein HINF_LOCUS9576 [Hexamita inflata]
MEAYTAFYAVHGFLIKHNPAAVKQILWLAAQRAISVLEASRQCKCTGPNSQSAFLDSGGLYRLVVNCDSASPSQTLVQQLFESENPPMSQCQCSQEVNCSSYILDGYGQMQLDKHVSEQVELLKQNQNLSLAQEIPNRQDDQNTDTIGLIFTSEVYSFAISQTRAARNRIAPALIKNLGMFAGQLEGAVCTGNSDILCESNFVFDYQYSLGFENKSEVKVVSSQHLKQGVDFMCVRGDEVLGSFQIGGETFVFGNSEKYQLVRVE